MDQNKLIARSIKSMVADINAEVIVADLLDGGMSYDQLIVKHDGLFKRNFSRDIIDSYYDMLNKLLVLHVSRDSLYDILPHGFFHHMFSDFSSEKREAEFVKLKQEEESARKLFLPYDYAFFIQKSEIEKQLRKYLNNPVKFFEDLFLFDKKVPAKYATKLAGYMLFADMIIGNPGITASILSDIIGEEVQHSETLLDNNLFPEQGISFNSYRKLP